jgi:hypothetical protein
MPNYLVRMRGSGEALGLFAVRDHDDLLLLVDEVVDPPLCEYAEIGSGSVVWEGRVMRLPAPGYDWDNERRPMLDAVGAHSLGGNWINALTSDTLQFKPCVADSLPRSL